MKKFLFFTMLTAIAFSTANINYALDTKSADYEVIKETAANSYLDNVLEKAEIIKEDNYIKIIKSDNKYAIYDKKTKTFIFKPVIDELQPLNSKEDEFRITIKDLKGYVNTTTKSNFLIKCDDLNLVDKYIKVKNNGKYGLLDKNGNTILQPVYQQLSVVNENGNEYFSAKYEGKNKLFYKTGKLIPDNELYTISYDSHYMLAKDIRPEFINYKKENSTLYDKAKYQENFVYEIKEVKAHETKQIQNDNYDKSNADIIIINNKEYTITENGTKVGLNSNDGHEIIPPVYKTINFKKPCKHFSQEVILADNGKYITIYDLKGNIIAEQNSNKVNIYKNKRVYFYVNDNDNWNLYLNKKHLGNLEITENGYKFTRKAIHLHSLHKINELLLAIISAK